MKTQLIAWLSAAWQVSRQSNRRIVWNLFLAFVPLVLSVWLFRRSRSRSLVWWAGFLVFIAFLPNAPYVLTDVIHLIDYIRQGHSVWIVTLVLIPQYVLFIFAGFEAYVISLINLGYYLHRQGLGKYIFVVELITHALCAVGIYLGRFKRFNSWDFVTQPDDLVMSMVEDLAGKRPVLVMAITFVVLAVLYWLIKQVTLGIALRMRYRKNFKQQTFNKEKSKEI